MGVLNSYVPCDDRAGIGSSFCLCIRGASRLTPTCLGGALPGKDTEPIAVTTYNWPAGHPHLGRSESGEYLAFWYVGQIAEDAVSGLSSFPYPHICDTKQGTLIF